MPFPVTHDSINQHFTPILSEWDLKLLHEGRTTSCAIPVLIDDTFSSTSTVVSFSSNSSNKCQFFDFLKDEDSSTINSEDICTWGNTSDIANKSEPRSMALLREIRTQIDKLAELNSKLDEFIAYYKTIKQQNKNSKQYFDDCVRKMEINETIKSLNIFLARTYRNRTQN